MRASRLLRSAQAISPRRLLRYVLDDTRLCESCGPRFCVHGSETRHPAGPRASQGRQNWPPAVSIYQGGVSQRRSERHISLRVSLRLLKYSHVFAATVMRRGSVTPFVVVDFVGFWFPWCSSFHAATACTTPFAQRAPTLLTDPLVSVSRAFPRS